MAARIFVASALHFSLPLFSNSSYDMSPLFRRTLNPPSTRILLDSSTCSRGKATQVAPAAVVVVVAAAATVGQASKAEGREGFAEPTVQRSLGL